MIVYIPARLGSKRFPNKVIKKVSGEPLIGIVCKNVIKSKYVDEIVVLTEDDIIYNIIVNIGDYRIKCINNTFGINGTNRVFNAISLNKTTKPFTVIQADILDLSAENLDLFFSSIINSTAENIYTAVCPMVPNEAQKSQNVKAVIDNLGVVQYFSRSMIPYGSDFFLKHIGIYAFLSPVIQRYYKELLEPRNHMASEEDLEQLDWMMKGIKMQAVKFDKYIRSVDTPQDLIDTN